MVRAPVSHQRGLGSFPILGIICGWSLLVLLSALRGFPRALRFSRLLKNLHLIRLDLCQFQFAVSSISLPLTLGRFDYDLTMI